MLILHGTWLQPNEPPDRGKFIFWAETSDQPTPLKGRGRLSRKGIPQAQSHPFQATPERIRVALSDLVPDLTHVQGQFTAARVQLHLPSKGQAPQPSPQLARAGIELAAPAESVPPHLTTWIADAVSRAPVDALTYLAALPEGPVSPQLRLELGDDVRFWSLAAKFALELLARQRFLPTLMKDDGGGFRAVWSPILDDPADQSRFDSLVKAMPPICRAVQPVGPPADLPPDPRALLDSFLRSLTDAAVREWTLAVWPGWLKTRHVNGTRARKQPEANAGQIWLDALLAPSPVLDAPRPQLLALRDQYQAWVDQLHVAGDAVFRICFRLEPPEAPTPGPSGARIWTLRFFLQALDDPSLLVPVDQVWRESGGTLRYLNRRFDRPQERLLGGLGHATRMFPPLERSLKQARPEACDLDVNEAYGFLRETARLFEETGFGVLVPPWWASRKAGLSVRLRIKPSRKQAQTTTSGILGLDTVVAFDWQLALGGEPLSREEFEKLAALKQPLVQIRGQWVELRPDQVEAAIRFWESRRAQDQMSLADALQISLAGDGSATGLPVESVETEGWIDELIRQLGGRERLAELPPPAGFVGQLRPYQVRGYSWLEFMRQWGFGACLADDMGLGKTIQTISLMLHDKEHGPHTGPVLLLCPTSVVGNWEREVQRFAPSLRTMIHHGASRARGEEFAARARQHDLVISSYPLVHRDEADLTGIDWSGVVLDEAQNIKNPSTKQTQAVRKLPAGYRVALTGTPVENRLSELWSIMEFLNPGYLGSQKDFRTRFALPIERYRDQAATQRLKSLVQPFILRRLKTDPKIIQDLPDKLEIKVFCNLSREQATLYEAVVRDSLKQIEESEGMQRRGIILATLMKLKQVCNHPAQFLGDHSSLPGRSGKLARLTEMLEEVFSVGDRALVFTQFAEMGEMLQAHVADVLGGEVLFLHGGTPRKQREKLIARFQADEPGSMAFILSLKAGGTGLNLTKANHVFHFDRWWNPAVENQATDRAFRIGQMRNVQVYKYICAGTLEERIDEMIESKLALAQNVLGAGEAWLTELSTEQLRDLFTLRREAVGEE